MNDSNENSLVSCSPQPCVLTMFHCVIICNPLTWYCFVSFSYSLCDHVFLYSGLYCDDPLFSQVTYIKLALRLTCCMMCYCYLSVLVVRHWSRMTLSQPTSLSSVQFLETILALSFLEQKHMDHPKCLKKRSSCLIELR